MYAQDPLGTIDIQRDWYFLVNIPLVSFAYLWSPPCLSRTQLQARRDRTLCASLLLLPSVSTLGSFQGTISDRSKVEIK